MINTTQFKHSRHDGALRRVTTSSRQRVYLDLESKTGSPTLLDHAKVSKERISQQVNNSSVPTMQAERPKQIPTDL